MGLAYPGQSDTGELMLGGTKQSEIYKTHNNPDPETVTKSNIIVLKSTLKMSTFSVLV